MRTIGNGSRNFKLWPSDDDDTRAGTPSPDFQSTERRFSLYRFNVHPPLQHSGASVVLDSNL
ncbi:UNVERIFIED_CONTAM: hypothetical protein NCL1_25199 [Trichonephila clavipes]